MQVSALSNNTLSSAVPVSGAVNTMLPTGGELNRDALIAPVEAVTYSESPDAPKEQDTYSKPLVVADTEAEQTQDAKAAEKASIQAAALAAQEIDDLEIINSMKARDQEVRTHEQAHMAVGGKYAGAASYTYETGPDGVRYAVGGEVPIDISGIADDPAATAEKMQQVQRAALAPAEPSNQDRMVAAQAGQIAAEALNELAQLERERRMEAIETVHANQKQAQEELKAAREEQERSGREKENEEKITAAERFAEYNARLRQINQTLLEISAPPSKHAGSVINHFV